LDGLSYTRTIIDSWTKLSAAVGAVPDGGTATFALGATFDCDYDFRIGLVCDPHDTRHRTVTIHGNGATCNAQHSGIFFYLRQGGYASTCHVTLTLDGMTLKNGAPPVCMGSFSCYFGGAVFNDGGTVAISSIVFEGNDSDGGGAIYNKNGSITIRHSTFTSNSVDTVNGQGGLGGAILCDGCILDVGNCTFRGNSAKYAGGAIYTDMLTEALVASVTSPPVITIADSTFSQIRKTK
jgi:predicted outer membrane repeat protein